MKKSKQSFLISICILWFGSYVMYTFGGDNWWTFPFAITTLFGFAGLLVNAIMKLEDGE